MFQAAAGFPFLLFFLCGLFLFQPADIQAQRRRDVRKNVQERHQRVKDNVQSRRKPMSFSVLFPKKYYPTLNKATGNELYLNWGDIHHYKHIKTKAVKSSRGLQITESNRSRGYYNFWTATSYEGPAYNTITLVWYLCYDKARPGEPLKWVRSNELRDHPWGYEIDFEYHGAGGMYYYLFPKGHKNKLAIEEKNGTYVLGRYTGRDNQKFKFVINP